MASLSGKKALRVGELADIVLAKQPTVTKLVGRMSEAGWVKRVDAPHDKRQSLVSLTATRQRKVKPLLAKARAHAAWVSADIGLGEVVQLKRVSERMSIIDIQGRIKSRKNSRMIYKISLQYIYL